MSVLTIAVLLFLALETMNILLLYFFPGSRRGNAVGVFRAWDASKRDPEVHALVRYLVDWVAGTKLIFVALLVVLVLTAGPTILWWSVVALVLSIASFFWRLFPAIRAMDRAGAIEPAGYSTTLGVMIAGFQGAPGELTVTLGHEPRSRRRTRDAGSALLRPRPRPLVR